MPLRKLAASHAHQLLAELIEAGLLPPTDHAVGVARNEELGVQVVITITPYQGPMRLHPETLERIQALTPKPATVNVQTGFARRVLNVLVAGETAKGVVIARRLKRSYGGGFRHDLASLVKAGVLQKVKDGYRRTS